MSSRSWAIYKRLNAASRMVYAHAVPTPAGAPADVFELTSGPIVTSTLQLTLSSSMPSALPPHQRASPRVR